MWGVDYRGGGEEEGGRELAASLSWAFLRFTGLEALQLPRAA